MKITAQGLNRTKTCFKASTFSSPIYHMTMTFFSEPEAAGVLPKRRKSLFLLSFFNIYKHMCNYICIPFFTQYQHTDRYEIKSPYLHWEVMCAVVGKHIAHTLIQHGEEGVEGTEASEVHDVVQPFAKLQTFDDDTVQREEGRQNTGSIPLNLQTPKSFLITCSNKLNRLCRISA